jgi:hypothetical protein
MRRATWATLGVLGLSGCETVESSGTPFQPVAVASPAAAGSLASAALGDTESEEPKFRMSFDGDTTKVVSGPADLVAEQKAKEASDGVADAAKPAQKGPLDDLLASAQAAPSEPRVPAPMPTGSAYSPPPMTSAPPVADPTQVGGWPVRLVKTIPDAQPPRAVLGLPSGKEIVVTPGTMIPEQGLVVVAIGPNRVQLGQVTSQGDHANITSITLDAMY